MNKKQTAWNCFVVFAVLSVTLEQLSVIFAETSPLLESIFFVAATVGTPAVLLAMGADLRRRSAEGRVRGKALLVYAYSLVLSILLTLIFKHGFGAPVSTHIVPAEEVMLQALLVLTAVCLLLLALSGVPAWLLFVASLVLAFAFDFTGWGEAFPVLHVAFRGLPYLLLGWWLAGSELPALLRQRGAQVFSGLFLLAFGCVAIWDLPLLQPMGQLFFTPFYPLTAASGELLLLHLLKTLLTLVALFAMFSLSTLLGALFPKPKNVLCAAVFLPVLRIFTYQGWYVSILRTISKAHWLILYVPLMLVIAAMLLSETMEIFLRLLMLPVQGGAKGKRLRSIFRNMAKYRFLLLELVKKGIVLKYRRSFLGILWSLIEPLLTMMVLTYVFRNFFGHGEPLYAVYILTGRLMFTLFQSTTKEALRSIRSNASMIKKVYVPKYMYPLSTILYNFVLFLISLIDLGVVMAYKKVPLTWHLLEGFVPIFVLLLFAVGVGMLLATINVFFRDIEYLWNVFCLLLMYCSAVFYKVDALKASSAAWIFKVNPVYLMIYNLRRTVMEGKGLDRDTMVLGCIFAAISLFVGFTVFYRKQDEFILHI